MKYAIIGSRDFGDREQVEQLVYGLLEDSGAVVVTGGARGVDTWAEEAAKTWEIPVMVFKPEYDKHPGNPKIAPLMRNQQIIDAADYVYAFWDGKSTGTLHAIKYAITQGKSVTIFPPFYKDPEQEGGQ